MAVDQVSLLNLALQVVSQRVTVLLTAGMAFALYCWSMWEHSWISLAIASAFAVLVFLPVLLKGAFSAKDHQEIG